MCLQAFFKCWFSSTTTPVPAAVTVEEPLLRQRLPHVVNARNTRASTLPSPIRSDSSDDFWEGCGLKRVQTAYSV
jgi:hypothetical protein